MSTRASTSRGGGASSDLVTIVYPPGCREVGAEGTVLVLVQSDVLKGSKLWRSFTSLNFDLIVSN